VDEVAQVWERTERRGRGRPPTIGEYRAIAEAKKAVNDEKERELQLTMESRILDMAETLAILRKSRLNPEDTAEEATLDPTADIASKIREAMAEVVRVSKISRHLQGPMQRALRVAASTTMGLADVLRTRADETAEATGNEELRQLRERVARLVSEQERTNSLVQSLREEVVRTKEEATTAKQKAKAVRMELQNSIKKNEELRRRLREEREKMETNRKAESSNQRVDEPMEVEQTSPNFAGEDSPTPAPVMPTERELRDFPALRPALQGRRAIIPDRPLPPPEIERDMEAHKVSTKRKKGTRGIAWDQWKPSPRSPHPRWDPRRAWRTESPTGWWCGLRWWHGTWGGRKPRPPPTRRLPTCPGDK